MIPYNHSINTHNIPRSIHLPGGVGNFNMDIKGQFNSVTVDPGPLLSPYPQKQGPRGPRGAKGETIDNKEIINNVVSTKISEAENNLTNLLTSRVKDVKNVLSNFVSEEINNVKEILTDIVSIPQNQISITYTEIYQLKNNKLVIDSLSRDIRVNAEDGGFGFHSLVKAVEAFNKSLVDNDVKTIGLLQIIFGYGQTWVREAEHRNLTGPGCAYSSSPFKIDVGRPETFVQNVRIIGAGQGASTIRGSCILNFWNIQDLGVMSTKNNVVNPTPPDIQDFDFIAAGAGAAQFDLQLVLQNFFWAGWFALNLKYSEEIPNMNPPDDEGYNVFDRTKNIYTEKSPVSSDDLAKWRSNKAVEILMMNVWTQLSDPPLGTNEDGNFIPIIKLFTLETPLFFLNAPAVMRIFISSCNWISYVMPSALSPVDDTYGDQGLAPALTELSFQFLNTDAVTDTFFQLCSFSSRAFAAPSPEFRSIQLWGNGKVSVANCQFSGRCVMQCNKIAAMGCYFLGTGIMPGEEWTTHALVMMPPDWYFEASAKKYGLPSGPRLILSDSQFVCHTKDTWNSGLINLKQPPIDVDGKTTLPYGLELLPFSYCLWKEPQVVATLNSMNHEELNVQFNGIAFYMVSMNGATPHDGFKFKAMELTNFAKSDPINTSPNPTHTL